jgi:hypothetical protein
MNVGGGWDAGKVKSNPWPLLLGLEEHIHLCVLGRHADWASSSQTSGCMNGMSSLYLFFDHY